MVCCCCCCCCCWFVVVWCYLLLLFAATQGRKGNPRSPTYFGGDSGKDPPPVKQKPRSQGIGGYVTGGRGDPRESPGKGSWCVVVGCGCGCGCCCCCWWWWWYWYCCCCCCCCWFVVVWCYLLLLFAATQGRKGNPRSPTYFEETPGRTPPPGETKTPESRNRGT